MTTITRTQVAGRLAPQQHLSDSRRRKVIRNLTAYVVGVMTLSVLGGVMVASGAEAGALVFLAGPLLMAVLLRTLGGDGWADAGLRLGPLRWYSFALLIFPGTFGLILGVGVFTGWVVLSGTIGAFLTTVGLGLAPRLVFAGLEEWGWRGYLEPRLAEMGVPDLRRHLMVGSIWAVWHVPYIITTSGYSDLSPWLLAPLLLTGVLVMAVVYGQLRKLSGSVWPVVLAHGLGNVFAYPLVFGDSGFAEFLNPAVLATRPESLLFIVIWVVIGWTMMGVGGSKVNGAVKSLSPATPAMR